MSDVLVVQWGRLRVAAGKAVGHGHALRLQPAWGAAWPEKIVASPNPKEAAEWLRQEWTKAGLSSKSAWVIVPRDEVILRHLELPAAPDDELPDMVRFQAAARSSVPLEQLALDFLPLPEDPDRPGRDVLSATISRSRIEALQTTFAALQMDVVGLSASSIGLEGWTVEQCRHFESASGKQPHLEAALTVAYDGPRVELVVISGRQLVYSHAARVSSEIEGEACVPVLSEVQRTLVAARRLRPRLKIDHGWVVGGDPALAKVLAEQLSCPVEAVAEATPGGVLPTEAAVLRGQILQRELAPQAGLNFLAPRKAPPKRDPRKLLYAWSSAVALAVVFLVAAVGLWVIQSMDREKLALSNKVRDLDQRIREGKSAVEAAGHLGNWQQRDLNQIDQLVLIEDALPGGLLRPYLSKYTFTVSGPKQDSLGRINIAGRGKNREHIETFRQEMVDREVYRVPAQPILEDPGEDYPARFTMDIDRLPAKKPTLAAATGKPTPGPAPSAPVPTSSTPTSSTPAIPKSPGTKATDPKSAGAD